MNTLKNTSITKNRRTPANERGVALIAAILTLVLISAIVAGMIVLSTTDTNISANFRDEQRAYFSAKAGMEEARDRLRKNTTTTSDSLRLSGVAPTTLPGGTGSVLYILNPLNGETVDPWNSSSAKPQYRDDELCTELPAGSSIPCTAGPPSYVQASSCTGWCNSVTASSTYAASPVLDYKWVRVTLKQNNQISPFNVNGSNATTYNTYEACWNGTNEYADATLGCTVPNLPVYILTALAVTPGGSRRMIQTEVAEDQINFNTPAALMMDGTGDAFSGGTSSQWAVSGNDVAGCGSTTVGPPVHAVGVPDNADIATVTTGATRPTNYTGSGSTTPDIANVSSTMPTNLQTVSGLQTLMSTIKNHVTQPVLNCPTGCSGLSNPGTATAPEIIYVNGNLSISGNLTGYGILAVTGVPGTSPSLNISGTVTWNGVILIIGQGSFATSGTPQYNGAIVVAQTQDALGNLLSTPGPGSAVFNVNGGGHGGVQYSTGCIAQATQLSTFHVMVLRELMN